MKKRPKDKQWLRLAEKLGWYEDHQSMDLCGRVSTAKLYSQPVKVIDLSGRVPRKKS